MICLLILVCYIAYTGTAKYLTYLLKSAKSVVTQCWIDGKFWQSFLSPVHKRLLYFSTFLRFLPFFLIFIRTFITSMAISCLVYVHTFYSWLRTTVMNILPVPAVMGIVNTQRLHLRATADSYCSPCMASIHETGHTSTVRPALCGRGQPLPLSSRHGEY